MSTEPNLDKLDTIRSDLWNSMSIVQLSHQRELVLDRLTKLQTMMNPSAPPSIKNIYGALQQALRDLTELTKNAPNTM